MCDYSFFEILCSNLGENRSLFKKLKKMCDYSHTSNNEQIVSVTIVKHFLSFWKPEIVCDYSHNLLL